MGLFALAAALELPTIDVVNRNSLAGMVSATGAPRPPVFGWRLGAA